MCNFYSSWAYMCVQSGKHEAHKKTTIQIKQ